ncbi:MAG: hypothetical protein F8N37_23245 [Telmatospirillum sp.]|nr:hypothetical protein [Telmatospirillum sp.]
MNSRSFLLAQAQVNDRDGDLQGAEILYRGFLAECPDHIEATRALGRLLVRRGDLVAGIAVLHHAADLSPASAEILADLGAALGQAGQERPAQLTLLTALCLNAIAVNPGDIEARFHLGMTLHQAGRTRFAIGAFREAIALCPDFAELHNNLGIFLQSMLRNKEAVTAHRRAVALAPWNAGHHCNLAHAALAAGQLGEGFAEWEWRPLSPPRDFPQPKWDGAAFAGKTLLAHAEQGFGDTLQFCRYLPAAAALGGRVIVECRAPLVSLLARMPGVAQVIPWGEPLPPFDLQIPIPSLAHVLGHDEDQRADHEADHGFSDPPARPAAPHRGDMSRRPYLTADPARIDRWRARAARDGTRRVGLVWAGNAAGRDPLRAIPPDALARLAEIPGIALIGCQRDGADSGGRIGLTEDWGAEIADFDDLAGAIATLDLLISVDTAAAHLAGALGQPVWTLLHAAPDWRWQGGEAAMDGQLDGRGGACRWYPSMRLYRQNQPGDWEGLVGRVATALRHWADGQQTADRMGTIASS